MELVVETCGNCGATNGNVPRPDNVSPVVARILSGGCPECLAIGKDRFFDADERELDPTTWRPISAWRRALRDLGSARVPGAFGASMAGGSQGGSTMYFANGLLTGGGIKWKKASAFGGEMKAPRFIVLHDTAGGATKFSTVNYFAAKGTSVSAHFVVERDGTITQMVATNRRAYHAGQSKWRGISGLNSCSIGIEIVNPGKLDKDGKAWFGQAAKPSEIKAETTPNHGSGFWLPYSQQQIDAVTLLCREIVEDHTDVNEIITHWMISPGRKIDVNPLFPLEEVRRAVFDPAPEEIAKIEAAVKVPTPAPTPSQKIPEPVKEGAKDKTVWALFLALWGYVTDFFFGIGEAISNGLGNIVNVLGPAQQETETAIAPLMSLTRTLQINLGKIALWATIAVLAVTIVKIARMKVSNKKMKEQLPESPEEVEGVA